MYVCMYVCMYTQSDSVEFFSSCINRSWVGLIRTGRSIYVEPMEVVERTNELKSIQADLKAEEVSGGGSLMIGDLW